MCRHCYDDWGYHGCHYAYPRFYSPLPRYYEEPRVEGRREYLVEEKKILERRLKLLEDELASQSK